MSSSGRLLTRVKALKPRKDAQLLTKVSAPLDLPRVLVVVPCGRSKIWNGEPNRGPARAADAYTGTLFSLNRSYAERFGDDWIILSAKYGFISPDFEIPETYEVTFNRKGTNPISHERLRQQVKDLRLDKYSQVVALGGAAYRDAVTEAFASSPVHLVFPFAGLPIGRMLQATKRALDNGHPGYELEGG